MELSAEQDLLVDRLIQLSLAEDVGDGDHTSLATIPKDGLRRARLLVKENGVLCGVGFAEKVIRAVDPTIRMEKLILDGADVIPGDVAFYLEGPPISILTAERLLLNGMQRMSGIASYTRKLVNLISDTKTLLLDTRKTAPGMRVMEKWAVKTGGGANHRMGLYDQILIKDNHVDYAGGIVNAIDKVHEYFKEKRMNLFIEIETRNFDEIQQVLNRGGVQRILLDNFSAEDIAKAVQLIAHRFETEASGGINENTLRSYALTGIDYISMGALTHQVRSLDLSLKAL
ncbi:MAG: carboxylating nicotinate-nucleotide diphosphorylase [Bacteroidia bacterium]